MTNKLKSKLEKVSNPHSGVITSSLWKGPYKACNESGVTFSMLSRFLICRERFRIMYVEGLGKEEQFDGKIEFGQMWHLCEEAYKRKEDHIQLVRKYVTNLKKKYQLYHEAIEDEYDKCIVTFPLYVKYWEHHPDEKNMLNLFQEKIFGYEYTLPISGRKIYLRGKIDSGDKIQGDGIYVADNKSKGNINLIEIQNQLNFDLQMMMYLLVLKLDRTIIKDPKQIKGIRYNIVRHSLHKHTKKDGTREKFRDRLKGIIEEDLASEPDNWFSRFQALINEHDMNEFLTTSFNPILEQLCDWWDCLNGGKVNENAHKYQNFRYPYGIYHVLNQGGSGELDLYLNKKSKAGLVKRKLFRELNADGYSE